MANITLVEGMLSIDQEGQEQIIIAEQPMAVYERFFIFYSLALSVMLDNQEATFTALFIENKSFRQAIIGALQAMGIEHPEQLTPRAIQQLIIARPGPIDSNGRQTNLPGYLFTLHNEVAPSPKLMATKRTNPTKRTVASTLLGWWRSILLKIQPLLTYGLSVAF